MVAIGIQQVEQRPAQQGFAGADLASHLDKALAFAQRHPLQVQAGLLGRQLDQKLGVGGQRERLLTQPEVGLIHALSQLFEGRSALLDFVDPGVLGHHLWAHKDHQLALLQALALLLEQPADKGQVR